MPNRLGELLESGQWKRPTELEHISGDFPIDKAVMRSLPDGYTLRSADTFATSAFSITGRLKGSMANSKIKEYFIKGRHTSDVKCDEGKVMIEGEFTSLRAIQHIAPDLVPSGIAWGKLDFSHEDLRSFFLIEDFIDLDDRATPDPETFASRLACMHLSSQSPTRQFGFDVPTCDGPLPHPVTWTDSWPAFFADLLRSRVLMDAEACGKWPELERAAEQVISKVVPRLLNRLTWQDKPIRPSLIHGDLWDDNVGVARGSQKATIFDAGSYYAHNEMELGIWRVIYAKRLGRPEYMEAYQRYFPPAEPVEEWDDRNRLYSLKNNLNWSATDPGTITRKLAYNDMCYLCKKYAPLGSIDEYDPSIDPMITLSENTPDL